MTNSNISIKRGDVFWANLGPYFGSEQGGTRPVVIIQNDSGNRYSSTTIVVPMTSKFKKYLPTHVKVNIGKNRKVNTALCEQIKVISKERLYNRICHLTDDQMKKISNASLKSIGIDFDFLKSMLVSNKAS